MIIRLHVQAKWCQQMVTGRGKAIYDPASTYCLGEFYCIVVCLNLKRLPLVFWKKKKQNQLISKTNSYEYHGMNVRFSVGQERKLSTNSEWCWILIDGNSKINCSYYWEKLLLNHWKRQGKKSYHWAIKQTQKKNHDVALPGLHKTFQNSDFRGTLFTL